jgi:hypothetical protein
LETDRGRNFNDFGFYDWINSSDRFQFAKLDCLFNYFQRISKDLPDEFVTFHRRVLSDDEREKLSLHVSRIFEIWCIENLLESVKLWGSFDRNQSRKFAAY